MITKIKNFIGKVLIAPFVVFIIVLMIAGLISAGCVYAIATLFDLEVEGLTDNNWRA